MGTILKQVVKMKGSIYIIKNKINDKVYIGQTTQTIQIRFVNHKMASRTGEDTKFYRAIRKYGEDNFYIELIEEIEIDKLNEREQYWIKKYDSYYNGYNSTLGGNQPYKINYEKVKDLWEEGLSIREIADNLKCGRDAISRILKQIIKIPEEKIKERGFQKNRTTTKEKVLQLWNNGLTPHQIQQQLGSTDNTIKKILLEENISESEWKTRITNNNRKADSQEVLNLWKQGKCLTEIAKILNVTHTSTIRKQLLEQGVTNLEIEKRRNSKVNQNAKSVVQLTLENEYVNTYSSSRQAEIQTGVAKSTAINACCNHKPKHKTAGGYKWIFEKEYKELNNMKGDRNDD